MDIDALHLLLLIGSGVAAGFVNTIAGGGSIFTLPALILLGMPADVANGTNRVGVLLQSLTAVRGFDRHNKLDRDAVAPIVLPTIVGALLGSAIASVIPVEILKPVLLGTMMAMTLFIVLKPGSIPDSDEPVYSLQERPAAIAWLFFAGLYGGFVQAGVGFILLTALAGVLRYDLLRANALKMMCTLVFSLVALGVFIYQDQVLWIPGLIVGLGSIVGVQLSVKFAISARQQTLKWILLGMAMLVCVAALLK
ncbi:sulfite exporter TauE/SafE family protein [Ketobacter sp.]|uniref:sulfite exporter TauE/SafE family protein n=1 Tax=Ketobacter sp. TaxID=2083498 RepID=UPI000F2C1C67|nr:sulfite exporter TauE/SafE family protein [Ketobacter sp.]RLU00494.1 MAG: sulfite exporter TauE/SafE family protein [Ketobacter sp.]